MPADKKEIQSFLWFAGYYTQHIKDFASIARPLYKLCDKDRSFEITFDRIKAFEYLKQVLTTAPLLLMPNSKLTFKLYIDASGDGLCAVLHQFQIINDKHVEGPIVPYPGKSNQLKLDGVFMPCLGLRKTQLPLRRRCF
ncbi:hypothetical protein O181_060534 [Austropuccinia psidii MF-1]|uniref:Reverse transcriptase/retrotransposon-derived protein RNase H-like domain-containing protein n=1 Tax=Austropuccinia psidii MF-1 TaxID=1389203 RepID=A0A9Q3EGI8_9BASI|nr:hypothetical protein [Austropuccinia psidii MF-1]